MGNMAAFPQVTVRDWEYELKLALLRSALISVVLINGVCREIYKINGIFIFVYVLLCKIAMQD